MQRDFTAAAPNQKWVTDFERHEALLTALEARDPDAAERAMREHIAVSRELLQDVFLR